MKKIELDRTKLLGFRIDGGAKLGAKTGAKIGQKLGAKNGLKVR
jgi:hypothetical protein